MEQQQHDLLCKGSSKYFLKNVLPEKWLYYPGHYLIENMIWFKLIYFSLVNTYKYIGLACKAIFSKCCTKKIVKFSQLSQIQLVVCGSNLHLL